MSIDNENGESVFDADKINAQIEKLEFAEKQAIGFYYFMEQWQQMGAMGYTKRLTKEELKKLDKWPELDTLEYFSIEQLYQLFITHQNIKQQ